MTNAIRVMLCDDSSTMRRVIKAAIKRATKFQVVYEAKNGRDAIDHLITARPDIVVMDVEMPEMDGIDAAREIRKRQPRLPIIMFSSLTSRGAEATLDALAAGANDFAVKPAGAGHIEAAMEHLQNELIPKLEQWTEVKKRAKTVPKQAPARFSPSVNKRDFVEPPRVDLAPLKNPIQARATSNPLVSPLLGGRASAIAIGVSTGGPAALASVISGIPNRLNVPILIAQHMPPVFTGLLAERLSAKSNQQVREAVDGEEVAPGKILIAPGDYHMTVKRDGTSIRIKLNQDPHVNSCRPAVDLLFQSFADCYRHRGLGIVLTGMGQDGTDGSAVIKNHGGKIIVQDKETSVVWGMPGKVYEAGLADQVLPIEQIAGAILNASGSANFPSPSNS